MSRARDLSQLISDDHLSLDSSNVGIGTTIPTAKLNVAGIVSATQFYGDGSNLDGVASAGLGTALAEGDDNPLSVIYYTDNVLSIGATITVDTPTSTNTAYTQYAEVAVGDGADLIVADGDDFVPDILGIGTDAIKELPGTIGGRIRADNFTNHAGTGKPTFQTGLNITGQCIADFFVGPLSGNASGLTGTPDITVGSVTATELRVGTGANQGVIKSHDGQLQISDQNGVSMGMGVTMSIITGPIVQAVESNHHYNVNTSAGIVTCTLPQTAQIGDYIRFIDNTGSFGLYTCFVESHASATGANSYIHGSTDDLEADVAHSTFTCTYTGFSTTGWIVK